MWVTGVQTCALPIYSAKEIKNVDLQRAVHILEKNVDAMVKGDVGPHNLVLTKASILSEDLIDDECLEGLDLSVLETGENKQNRGRKKKEYNNSNVRRTSILFIFTSW